MFDVQFALGPIFTTTPVPFLKNDFSFTHISLTSTYKNPSRPNRRSVPNATPLANSFTSPGRSGSSTLMHPCTKSMKKYFPQYSLGHPAHFSSVQKSPPTIEANG